MKSASVRHVTPVAKLDAVRTHGLQPEKSESSLAAVFLAGSIDTATNYALMKPGPHVVLSVPLSMLDAARLGPDNYELRDYLQARGSDRAWDDHTWQESLRKVDQVSYYATIPPQALTVAVAVPGTRKDGWGVLNVDAVDVPLASYQPQRKR